MALYKHWKKFFPFLTTITTNTAISRRHFYDIELNIQQKNLYNSCIIRQVASLLAQSMTETEIAEQLNVDQSTISRDVKALKEMSQQFVFDLAKSDLAYYYKQSIDGIKEAKEEA
jgi:Trp operon repressor